MLTIVPFVSYIFQAYLSWLVATCFWLVISLSELRDNVHNDLLYVPPCHRATITLIDIIEADSMS